MLQTIGLADAVLAKGWISAAGQFVVQDALQVEQLLLGGLAAFADGGQRGMGVGDGLGCAARRAGGIPRRGRAGRRG